MRLPKLLGLILLIGAILRLWQLGIVPHGVTYDELGYIINSYSIAHTGNNVFGERLPFLTWMVSNGFPFMPVPIYLTAPFFWILPLTATTGRLLYALLGIFDIALVYILVMQLFKNKNVALIASLLLAISPWHLHFSRTAYDPNVSLFFYLLGIVLFIFETQRAKIPWFSLFSFALALFSYRGMSIIALPLFLLLFWYLTKQKNISRLVLLGYITGVSLILLSFFVVIKIYGSRFTAEALSFIDSSNLTEQVDAASRDGDGPLPLKRIFLNKPSILLQKFREQYLSSYSLEYLSLYTEPNSIYSIWGRGRLFSIDIIFILLGLFFLWKARTSSAWFVLFLLIIGGLPGGIGGKPYSARNLFLSVIFPIITAFGIKEFFQAIKHPTQKKFLLVSIGCIYIYLFGSYAFDYYNRYANQQQESWAKSMKDVSSIIEKNQHRFDKLVVSDTTFGDVVQFAFYKKISASDIQRIWQTHENTDHPLYRYENVYFSSLCPNSPRDHRTLLLITRGTCRKNATASATVNDFYGNTIWRIYEE